MPNKTTYILTVGIETHVQLKTKSKLFSGADNNNPDAKPNSLVNHIDFGLPGALPVLNKKAVELASFAAFALNSKPQKFSKFDRKHYFYPDLPMGYQITQYDQPIILNGYVEFYLNGELKRVNITRAHLEADAGKSIHPEGAGYSLVDLNRAGTPLLEIVSEPEMHSASEARAYAHELYLLMRYANVSDANLYYGNMRFDVNVSVSTNNQLGTRTETKNLNSFRSVERAVEYEMKRQIEQIERGQEVIQETRGWDDTKNRGYTMRTKENADDYRYMPDPDLPPVELDDEFIDRIRKAMPKLPNYWRQCLAKLGIDQSMIESLIDGDIEFGLYYLKYLTSLTSQEAKSIANFIVNIELPLRRRLVEEHKSSQLLKPKEAQTLYTQANKLYRDGTLSSTNLKELITKLLQAEKLPANITEYISQSGLQQTSDEDLLNKAVYEVINANPKAVADIKAGQDKATGFLVGQVMKLTKGQANPEIVSRLIKAKLKL
ncbi:MAG: Asp-tRNA(Asn)/Glu-tRNA(Gln) amidotransferase subunit GatB [Candidatus Saccharimonadales bacterium]